MTTREEVIAAAKECGFFDPGGLPSNWGAGDFICNGAEIVHLYAIAFESGRQAEREECAKACEDLGENIHGPGREDSEAYDCADAIRARNTK